MIKITSEVLIMNKNAIAMAADSAVTVNNRKTYNGANKLFMLSNEPPMRIIIKSLNRGIVNKIIKVV